MTAPSSLNMAMSLSCAVRDTAVKRVTTSILHMGRDRRGNELGKYVALEIPSLRQMGLYKVRGLWEGLPKASSGDIGGFPAVEGSTRGIPPVDRSPREGCCFHEPHSGVSGSVARLETGPSLGVVAKDRSVVKL